MRPPLRNFLLGARSTELINPVQTGVAAWWDASDPTTIIATGSNVDTWNDKSGNGRNLDGSLGNPTTGIRNINGRNAIEFVAANFDQLSRANFVYGLGSFTFFGVYHPDLIGGSGLGTLWSEAHGSSSSHEFEQRMTTTDQNAVLVEAGSVRYNLNAAHTLDTDQLSTIIDTGTNISIQVNQDTPVTSAYTRTGGFSANSFKIGKLEVSGGSNGRWFDGCVGELIFYDSALSAGDITLIQNYLNTKWGLL